MSGLEFLTEILDPVLELFLKMETLKVGTSPTGLI